MRMAFGGPPRYLAAGKTMLRLMGLFNPFLKEFVEINTDQQFVQPANRIGY
jgi:hypothetical protein